MIALSMRLSFAFRCFFSLLSEGKIPQEILQAVSSRDPEGSQNPATTATAAAEKQGGEVSSADALDRAVQILALLQRDGRLIDFIEEDVSSYPDGQLGAAVRTIHSSCREVLDRYVTLEPVLASDEDHLVTVPAGFDPAAIKLVGNVSGAPPVRGLLRHRGWRVSQVKLPSLPHGAGRSIVAPAEVEVA